MQRRADHGRGSPRASGAADAKAGGIAPFLRRRDGHDGERAAGQSVYLRGWDDYERYSLQLTASTPPGSATRPSAREPAGAAAPGAGPRGSGLGIGWHEEGLGHGPAYRFRDPDGHLLELYYETEWYEAPTELSLRSRTKPSVFRPGASTYVGSIISICLAVDVRPIASSSSVSWVSG